MNQLVAFLGAVVALLPFLIPIGQFLLQLLGEKFLPSSQQRTISQVAATVVNGVEQGMQNAAGPDKKQAAIDAVNAILKHYRVKTDPALVDALIEEAVFVLNQMGSRDAPSELPTPATLGFDPAAASYTPSPGLRY